MAGFTINAIVLHQKGWQLYCFGMNSDRLKEICYVTPRSKDEPEEIQRILDPRRAKEIGEYIKQANSLLPNALVVALSDEVKIAPSGTDSISTLHFPTEHGKFAYILDGQHRLEGFKHSDGIVFDLPVVGIQNADETLRGKIFADINSKQERVSDVHLLSLYYQIKDLPVDETPVMDVVHRLNADPDSPLKGKIRMLDSDRGTWVNNTALKKWLSPHLMSGGALASRTVGEKTTIIKEYLSAMSQMWPDAWGDVKTYNLSRPIGFELMLALFGVIKQRCDLNAGKQYTAKNFLKQMAPLKDAVIDLPGGGEMTLDWRRGSMGIFSNRASRTLMTRQLTDILRSADET